MKIRLDKQGTHRTEYEKNKKRLLRTQNHCSICGKPIDMNLQNPDPLSPCIDHVIPVSKGGHPSDMKNLQLAHWQCNRQKSDKLFKNIEQKEKIQIGNRNLPQSKDWMSYRSSS